MGLLYVWISLDNQGFKLLLGLTTLWEFLVWNHMTIFLKIGPKNKIVHKKLNPRCGKIPIVLWGSVTLCGTDTIGSLLQQFINHLFSTQNGH